MRARSKEGVGRGDMFLSLGKAPVRTRLAVHTGAGVCCGGWDLRRISSGRGRERPLPSVPHLMEVPVALRDQG